MGKAIELQRRWAKMLRHEPLRHSISTVAGCDVAFSSDGKHCVAGIVVLRYPAMNVLTSAHEVMAVELPYIPGLLSFREAPAMVAAAMKLPCRPDVMLIDGQGFSHPRRFGLACHVGLELGQPTIGVAKSRLIGRHREPALSKGSRRRLMDGNEIIGFVVRSRESVKPLYVSVGHMVTLEEAVRIVLRCCKRYRLPEPTRLAHQLVSKLMRPPKVYRACKKLP